MIRLKPCPDRNIKSEHSKGIYEPANKINKKMKPKIFLLLSLIALFASCVKKPGSYPPEPQIYYLSTRPNLVNFKDTSSGVKIELKFTDGDGDIGRDPKQETQSIYLRDSRDTSTSVDYTFQYPFPFIDENMRPKDGGLEGFITVSLGRQYFSVSDSLHLALGKDTMHWDIYIKDEAGHKSNVISTDPIYIEL
jgi:hypothetical protein